MRTSRAERSVEVNETLARVGRGDPSTRLKSGHSPTPGGSVGVRSWDFSMSFSRARAPYSETTCGGHDSAQDFKDKPNRRRR
jgi:hypothetical protein